MSRAGRADIWIQVPLRGRQPSVTVSLVRRFGLAAASLALGGAFTLWATHAAYEGNRLAEAARYATLASHARTSLARRLDPYVAVLHGARAVVSSGRPATRAGWRSMVAAMQDRRHLPALRALGWVPALAPGEVATFLTAARADGAPDYQIQPRGYWPEYRPVRFMEPVARSRGAIGHDLAAVPAVEAALRVSRETGRVQLSEPLDPAFGDVGWSSVGLVLPVCREQPPAGCSGWVIAILDVAKLVRAAVAGTPELAASVYDGPDVDGERMLYHDPRHAMSPSAGEFARITLAGRIWLVGLTPRPGTWRFDHATGPLTASIGWVVTALLFLITWMAGAEPQPPAAGATAAAGAPLAPRPQIASTTPVAASPAESLPIVHLRPDAQGGLRILLAEHNPTSRSLAAQNLEREGHAVVTVADGEEAVARLAQEPFDVALLDLQMAHLGGLEAAARIRARGDQTLLVALAADNRPPDMERHREAGVDVTISKPVSPGELLDAIERVLAEGNRTIGRLEASRAGGRPLRPRS